MLFFLAGLFGFGLLILICGIHGREQERAKAVADPDQIAPAVARSFFATLGAAFDPPQPVDEVLVLTVERRLRRQTAAATRFVEHPSIDSLHDFEDDTLVRPVYSMLDRVQRFLAAERALVHEFVADPSLDRFHGRRALAG